MRLYSNLHTTNFMIRAKFDAMMNAAGTMLTEILLVTLAWDLVTHRSPLQAGTVKFICSFNTFYPKFLVEGLC